MTTEKLSIYNEMRQFDAKNRRFYADLSEEERKKFSPFLMIRWGSSVQGSSELQQYYVMACNENLNKNFFDIGRHPELQWLCATTVSPDMGAMRHNWIKQKKSEGKNNKVVKFLQQVYPTHGNDEIVLLARISTIDEIKDLAKKHGWDDKRIKSEL